MTAKKFLPPDGSTIKRVLKFPYSAFKKVYDEKEMKKKYFDFL